MEDTLKNYFPMLREREELLSEIQENAILHNLYEQMSPELKEEFLSFCTGMKGMKILRDSFFKEVVNPEYAPERLESLLSEMLERKVKIVRILPNDSTRISDETSLLITDIIVELEDGSLANVEIQKIGYAFPGPRSACYAADMLLRQYRRVRARQGKDFAYSQIKNVYLIVIYEKSPKEFKQFPNIFYHHSRQVFDSGLKLDLLQEFIMIPLDIYHKRADNKPIESKLEAWLAFLSDDRPERIIELITKYPEFKPMYETLYQMCLNTERVMNMFFSEELRILDRNTVQYMIDEQQKELEEKQKTIIGNMKELAQQREQIKNSIKEIAKKKEQIKEQRKEIASQKEQIVEQSEEIASQKEQIVEQSEEIAGQRKQIVEQSEEIAGQRKQIVEQSEEIAGQRKQIVEQSEEIAGQRKQIVEQSEELADQRKQIIEQKEELDGQRKQIIEKQKELDEQTTERMRLEEEVARLKKELEALREK